MIRVAATVPTFLRGTMGPWVPSLKILAVLALTVVMAACRTGFGRSGDTDLESLTVNPGTLSPAFNNSEEEYTVRVGANVESIRIGAVAEDPEATITIAGQQVTSASPEATIPLDIGDNVVDVEIEAENETRREIEIRVTREATTSDDARLSTLQLSGLKLSPDFDADQMEYQASAGFFSSALQVSAAPTNAQATLAAVLGDNDVGLSPNEPSNLLGFPAGNAALNVTVTAGDQQTTKMYQIQVSRNDTASAQRNVFIKASNTDPEDQFASALAASSDYLVVGSPGEASANVNSEADDSLAEAGAAYVYLKSAGAWSFDDYLKAESVTQGARFGASTAVVGDVIAVGAPGANQDLGSVTVFRRNSGTWETERTLPEPSDTLPQSASFGTAIAAYALGEREILAIGAPGDNSVRIYESDDEVWQIVATLRPDQVQSGDQFGASLAFNAAGGVVELAVGAPGQSGGEGAAYVFARTEGEWRTTAPAIKAPIPGTEDNFGDAVSLSGNLLAVGAPNEATQGASDHNDNQIGAGAVYVFSRESTNADFREDNNPAFLKVAREGEARFGSSVILIGGGLLVGAEGEDSAAATLNTDVASADNTSEPESGAVFVFAFDTGSWNNTAMLKADNNDRDFQFGYAMAVSDSQLLVGANKEHTNDDGITEPSGDGAENSGAVYVFQ